MQYRKSNIVFQPSFEVHRNRNQSPPGASFRSGGDLRIELIKKELIKIERFYHAIEEE
jgi:hypothetical protein